MNLRSKGSVKRADQETTIAFELCYEGGKKQEGEKNKTNGLIEPFQVVSLLHSGLNGCAIASIPQREPVGPLS